MEARRKGCFLSAKVSAEFLHFEASDFPGFRGRLAYLIAWVSRTSRFMEFGQLPSARTWRRSTAAVKSCWKGCFGRRGIVLMTHGWNSSPISRGIPSRRPSSPQFALRERQKGMRPATGLRSLARLIPSSLRLMEEYYPLGREDMPVADEQFRPRREIAPLKLENDFLKRNCSPKGSQPNWTGGS